MKRILTVLTLGMALVPLAASADCFKLLGIYKVQSQGGKSPYWYAETIEISQPNVQKPEEINVVFYGGGYGNHHVVNTQKFVADGQSHNFADWVVAKATCTDDKLVANLYPPGAEDQGKGEATLSYELDSSGKKLIYTSDTRDDYFVLTGQK